MASKFKELAPDAPVKIMQAGSTTGSIFASLHTAYKDVVESRHVIWRLFLRDFIAQFRQRVLGYFWAVLSPLFAIASFVFMYSAGFLNPGDIDVPYPLYVYFGTGVWGIMLAALQSVSNSMLANGELIMRTNVPAMALALAGMAALAYSVAVNTLVLMIVLLITGYKPSIFILVYPFVMLPLVMMGAGIGLVLAVIGTVARDITVVVMTFLGLWMYVTPVIYVTKFNNPVLQFMVKYNPVGYLIDVPRTLVFTGKLENGDAYILSTLIALLLLVLGVHSFYLIKDKVAERL